MSKQYNENTALQNLKEAHERRAFGRTKADAHRAGICISCAESVFFSASAEATRHGHIYSPAGMREYGISGLCEFCDDNMFPNEGE